MPKRIEQSRRHGPHDPRYTGGASRRTPPDAATGGAPVLRLVGGTDVEPGAVAPVSPRPAVEA